MKQLFTLPCLVLSLAIIAACDQQKIGDQSAVLARVNGEAITEAELNVSLESLFGEERADQLGADARQKALEALVSSRAIAQSMEHELTDEERQQIEYKAHQHKERLLVNTYLKRYANPSPVSRKMIEEYYQANLENYGGGLKRHYEVLQAESRQSEEIRDRAIQQLNSAKQHDDWQSFAREQRDNNLPLFYRSGVVDKELLNQKLINLLDSLQAGKPSQVMFIEGKPLIARIVSETEETPKPLAQVSQEIRKILVPQQIKAAIKVAQEEVVNNAEIEYTEQASQN